ncbi:MAG: ATP-binding cassette domain-containing protein [Candidatus Lokiarchaeota archaeon]|nr:ATP-binding cassette domain-containing protein [Candidatus Lokiarchaeota archaeon]
MSSNDFNFQLLVDIIEIGGMNLEVQRTILENMKNAELLRLAQSMKIPLVSRTITRTVLIDSIWAKLEEHLEEKESESVSLCSPALKLKNIRKEFGKKVAVKNLDIEVNPGEIVGLVGPNGAGKTTTLRILTGIISATEGQCAVNGHDIVDSPIDAKFRLGYIPEKPTCYPSLKVREYLSFVAKIYKVNRQDAIIRMSYYMDLFNLRQFENNYIGTLSKGNLQRTLIVGILVRSPPFILALDEPIYGLDPRGAWTLKALLRKMRNEGSAILVSTHILEVASGLCDRFVIMNEGDVVGKGTLKELMKENPGATTLEEVFLMLTGGLPE